MLGAIVMPDTIKTKTTIVSAIIILFATFALAVTSNYEHYRNPRPSSPIGIYLVVTWAFDIAKVRSLLAIEHGKPLAYMQAVTAAVKLGLIVLELKEKRAWLLNPKIFPAPQSTANFFNRLTFFWVNPLLLRGYKKPLQENDLFEVQDQIVGEKNLLAFAERWEKCEYNLSMYEKLVLTRRSQIHTRISQTRCSDLPFGIIGVPSRRSFCLEYVLAHSTSANHSCFNEPSDT
jgi:ATP-binding cassette subfamily C (CFTR/MRP) protein 1